MRRPRKIRTHAQLPKANVRNLAAEKAEEDKFKKEAAAAKRKATIADNLERLIHLALARRVTGTMTVSKRRSDLGRDVFDAIDENRTIQGTFNSRAEAQAFCNYFDEMYRTEALAENGPLQPVRVGFDPASPDGDRTGLAVSFMGPDGRVQVGTLDADGYDRLLADGTLDPSSIRVEEPSTPDDAVTLSVIQTCQFNGQPLTAGSVLVCDPATAHQMLADGLAVPHARDTGAERELSALCQRLAAELRDDHRPVRSDDLRRVFQQLIDQLRTQTGISPAEAHGALMRVGYAEWLRAFNIATESIRDRVLGDDDFDNVSKPLTHARLEGEYRNGESFTVDLPPFTIGS